MVHQPTLFLGSKKLTGIAAFREKETFLGKTAKVLTSFKTTAALGAVLGTLLFPSAALALTRGVGRQALTLIPKKLGGKLLLAGGIAAAVESPRLRRIIKTKFNPLVTGKELGKIIEDPTRLFPKERTPKGVFDKFKDVLGTAGLIGGVAAATVGGVILAKKGISKVTSLIPSGVVRSVAASPLAISPLATIALPSAATIEQPIGAVQKPIEDKKIPVAIPSIKIINKPQNIVDVRINQSKRFINQQVLIRS